MSQELTVILRNRNQGYLTFFVGLFLLGWTAITGTLIYALFFDNNGRYSFLFKSISILVLIGYFMWNHFLWNVNGKHVLKFNKTHLTIKKGGTLNLWSKRNIIYNDIYSFDKTKSKKASFISQLWGLGGETIVIKCKTRNVYIGAGWRVQNAAIKASELNKILKERKTA